MKRLLVALLASLLAVAAGAQERYPDKPVRFIVPFPPGGDGEQRGQECE